MSHPLLSRAEIEALLGERAAAPGHPAPSQPASESSLQEAGTGVAAWHELASLLWSNVASALSSAARPVAARIQEERLLDQAALAQAGQAGSLPGLDGSAIAFPVRCRPEWLSSWVVIPFAAVASLEELAGGEWGGAAHPYPTSLAALVGREMLAGLSGIIGPEASVSSGPQAISFGDLVRTGLKEGRWLGLSLELGWGSTRVPILHLFAAEVPVHLYENLVHQETAAAGAAEAVVASPATAAEQGTGGQAGAESGLRVAAATAGASGRPATPSWAAPSSSWGQWGGFGEGFGGPGLADRPVVKPVELPSFEDRQQQVAVEADNTQLLLDVPMNVSIELGHARLSMRDILSLGRGSTIELDRLVGEPVDVLVNGRLIAKGEVVLVDEAFGVRIVAIVPPGDRLREGVDAAGA